jgi:xylulose-5-phosphate/fructose-6-phosphate phosphoketolase
MNDQPLSTDELESIHAYWRAANYLSVGQIYLFYWDTGARHPD